MTGKTIDEEVDALLFVEKIEPDRRMHVAHGAAAVAAVLYPLQGVSNDAMEPAPIGARHPLGQKE